MADVFTFSHQKSVALVSNNTSEEGFTNWYQLPADGIGVITFSTSESESGERSNESPKAQMETAASTTDGATAAQIQAAFESNNSAEIFDLSHVSSYGAVSFMPLPFFQPGQVSGGGSPTIYVYIRFTDNVKHFVYQSIDSDGNQTITNITD